jgi:tRNA threonylcarbamoyladenosine biosynthesis protein TsaB
LEASEDGNSYGALEKTPFMMQEPLILAVETSSRVGSVALAEGPRLLAELTFSGPLRHSAELFPAVMHLLGRVKKRADNIRQVHITIGPGSFTGLRIAVALAKTMHLANGANIVTVDSLDTIAANLADVPESTMIQNGMPATALDHIATVLDAKRGQFYGAVYERTNTAADNTSTDVVETAGYRIAAPAKRTWRKIVPDTLLTANQLFERCAGLTPLGLLGDGLLYHQDTFRTAETVLLEPQYWSPRAAKLYTLGYQKACAGRFDDPVSLVPFYLRAPLVTPKKNR